MKEKLTFSELIKTTEFKERLNTLNKKEKKYFDIMSARSGVLYITSKPGIGKSAIMRSVAQKLGFDYYDVRLSMVDETDVGLFPTIVEIKEENGETRKFLSHVVPEWADQANVRPCIIHFEELNRATLQVRNAALQLLLERSIGVKFHFNENVLMCASGNLGEEDGTDVEEFDAALNGRLIHLEHTLDLNDWIKMFAADNVHNSIVNFIKAHAEHYYRKSDDQKHRAYASPRTWTFLSDYIINKFGKNAPIQEFINDIKEIGHAYVGPSSLAYIKYCEDTLRISVKDVINRFQDIKEDLKQFNRDKNSELIGSLKEHKISKMNNKQLSNVIDFILTVSEDETIAYILHVVDNEYKSNTKGDGMEMVEAFLKDKRLRKYSDTVYAHCSKATKSSTSTK